jgi:hypothetical protein
VNHDLTRSSLSPLPHPAEGGNDERGTAGRLSRLRNPHARLAVFGLLPRRGGGCVPIPPPPPTSAPDGDAVCFYHESKSAVVACDECGRFLCSLCELTIGTSRLCSSCLERQRSAGSHDLPIAVRVVRYDRIVLTIAMFSWLTGPFGLLAVLALSLWHRKKWLGPLGIGQYRYGLAVLVALATFLVVWGAVVLLISRIETPRWI